MRTDEVFDGEVAAVIKQAIRLVIEQAGGVAAEGIEFGHLSDQPAHEAGPMMVQGVAHRLGRMHHRDAAALVFRRPVKHPAEPDAFAAAAGRESLFPVPIGHW